MRRLSRGSLVLAPAALAICLAVVSNRAGADARNDPEAVHAANSKRDQIRAEIETLGAHPWAGEYYAGDGLGVNTFLYLAPKAGYVFEWHGCLGLYDRNYGSITEKDGKLNLSFTFENSREGFQGVAPELIPVEWDERRYLIPSDDMVGFCNQVNQGAEPRSDVHGLYFLRRGDEDKAAEARPKLPAEFQDYLLPKPVEATIVAVGKSTTSRGVGDSKFKDTPLSLGAGNRQGLKVGMELIVMGPGSIVETVTITKVEDDRSEGVMTQIGRGPRPNVGWRVSTRAPWHSEAE